MLHAPTKTHPIIPQATVPEISPIQQCSTTEQHSARVGHFLKSVLDLGLTIPGLLLIAPLLITLALMVKFDSPGPIIYKRRVLGKDGRIIYAYKFRTMHINGNEILARHPKLRAQLRRDHKLKNDPRITRVGHLLRKLSLDELPQLFNVIKREMSLIGPRMIAPEEICQYGQWGDTLLTVLPGLTGLWQVSGRSNTSYDQRVQLDMEYIHGWSILTDLKILLRTPLAVLKSDGAY